MENERNIDKLAGYIIKLGTLAAVLAVCWYFKNVLIYIIVAFVVSLIGFPIMNGLRKIKVKGKSAPDWLLAVLTIILIIVAMVLLVTQIIPLVYNIIRDVSAMNGNAYFESNPIDALDVWLISMFPSLGNDFDLTTIITMKLKELVSFSKVSDLVGSVASVVSLKVSRMCSSTISSRWSRRTIA